MSRHRTNLLVLLLVAVLAALPGAVRAGCLSNTPIPENGYIGTVDGNDGTGADAGMICCEESVFDFPGAVTDVNVSIALTHTWVGDLVIKLKKDPGNPSGTVSTLQSRAGAAEASDTGIDSPFGFNANWQGSTILYDEQSGGASAELMGSGLSSLQNVCLDNGVCAHTPNSDTGPGAGLDVDFDGQGVTGLWQLCVGDAAAGDTGTWASYVLDVKFNRTIDCACNGKFRGGDHVIYNPPPIVGPTPFDVDGRNFSVASPDAVVPPADESTGLVMCGANSGPKIAAPDGVLPLLVKWDSYNSGHDGNGFCECPRGDITNSTSGYWVFCEDVIPDLPWSDDFESGNRQHWSSTSPPEV